MADDHSSAAKRVRDSAKEYAAQRAYQAAYRAANKARRAEYFKKYEEANKGAKQAYRRQYYLDNLDRIKDYRSAEERRLAETARVAEWQRLNPEKVNAKNREYGKLNRHLGRAKTAKRNAALAKRTPPWAGELDSMIFTEAALLADIRTRVTGIAWDVDHVLPLRAKQVSGLHVWNNIQVIPASVNRSKGNRVTPEMLS